MTVKSKLFLKVTISLLVMMGLLIMSCYLLVSWNASGKNYDTVEEIPTHKVGLLLATSPITPAGAHNYYFDYRIQTADELYKAGKVDYIIASGGDYSITQKNGCDEPKAILDSLVARGIPKERIILDYEGTRTLYSIVKAKEIYALDSLILISQKYHNERAIWLAENNGIHAIAINAAPSPVKQSRLKNELRECLARVKMFIDILTAKKPVFQEKEDAFPQSKTPNPVEIVDTCNLTIYYPNYRHIDLRCGVRPAKSEETVIMFAAAAFTGAKQYKFKHENIAGDHVSEGKRERGYSCTRNTGAFVYYNGGPKFLYRNYSAEFNNAAKAGGCGFAQEMLIHEGEKVPYTRPASDINEFRALCMIGNRLAIADSKGMVRFDNFINSLKKAGAIEALYLDMGTGWNYSWYRNEKNKPVEIHHTIQPCATNWITFFK